jgi:hypothetical protein
MFVQMIRFRTQRYVEIETLINDNDPGLQPSRPGPRRTHVLNWRIGKRSPGAAGDGGE